MPAQPPPTPPPTSEPRVVSRPRQHARDRVLRAKQRLLTPAPSSTAPPGAPCSLEDVAALRDQVRQHPLAALAIGAAAGYLVTRHSGLVFKLAKSRTLLTLLPMARQWMR